MTHWAFYLLAALSLAIVACKQEPPPQPATAPRPVIAATRPTAALTANASCITDECHATFRTSPRIHQPVAGNACFACHKPDTGGHVYPLARTGNAVCTFCHAVSGTQAHQHKAVADPGCLACHNPHVSRTKFLLTADTVGDTCAKCHKQQLKRHAHEPFAQGQCTVCHQAHQSEFVSLLRNGAGPDHCFSCHTDKQKSMTQLPNVHKASLQSCTTCHAAHTSDFPKQLKQASNDTCLSCHDALKKLLATTKNVHGAVTTGCTSCHDPHASNQPHEIKNRMDKLCLTCHEKSLTTPDGRVIAAMKGPLNSKFLHGPVKDANCSACHNPHAGNEPNLLKQHVTDRFYAGFDLKNFALCFSCHDKEMVLQPQTASLTNFRDGTKNLHFVHVNRAEKGRTCKTCHETHGSDLPRHMAATVPFEGSSWSMPIQYESVKSGGACTPGCHGELHYDRNKKTPTTLPANTPSTRGAL